MFPIAIAAFIGVIGNQKRQSISTSFILYILQPGFSNAHTRKLFNGGTCSIDNTTLQSTHVHPHIFKFMFITSTIQSKLGN